MQNHITVRYANDGKCKLNYQQHELIASIDVEDKPELNITHSVTLSGRTLAIVCVYNNLVPNQSGYIYMRLNLTVTCMKSILIYVVSL